MGNTKFNQQNIDLLSLPLKIRVNLYNSNLIDRNWYGKNTNKRILKTNTII